MSEKSKSVVSRKEIKNKQQKHRTNHLLIIGIDEYSNGITSLNNAVRDAQNFRDLLLSKYQFSKENLTCLFNKEASRANIIRTFSKLLAGLTENDNLLFYYSGHGELLRSGTANRGYWIPSDAKFQENWTYIPNEEISLLFRNTKAHHVFGIVDSCFSGALFEQNRRLSPVVERLNNMPSRWLLTAGRLEPVLDGSLGQNSPFAKALLTYLKYNEENSLWVSNLCNQVLQGTQFNTIDQTPRGEPLQNAGHYGGQFVFYKKGYQPSSSPKGSENSNSPGSGTKSTTGGYRNLDDFFKSAEEESAVEEEETDYVDSTKPKKSTINKDQSGKLLYDIPDKMPLNEITECKVRIATNTKTLLRDLLKTDRQIVRNLKRITKVMNVELIDVTGGKNFSIIEGSSSDQYLEGDNYTEWLFYVSPLKSGDHQLLIRVSTIQILDNQERQKDLVFKENITVIGKENSPKKDINTIKTELRNLVAQDLAKGLEKFQETLKPDSSKNNDIILLLSRFNSNKKSRLLGIISNTEGNRTENQIRYALVEYIDDLTMEDI